MSRASTRIDFIFEDRLGMKEGLRVEEGECIAQVLLRACIPPSSVLVLRDGVPVSASHSIECGAGYHAALIEGYDIGAIRRALADMRLTEGSAEFVHRRLSLATTGAITTECAPLAAGEITAHVEDKVFETCDEFSLLEEGDHLLIGLSGGVDSSALALVLSALRDRLPPHQVTGVTFEDTDSKSSPAYRHAPALAASLGLDHRFASAKSAREIFHLNEPLTDVLRKLMETGHAHHVMYIDHHTTRRALEFVAEQIGANRICLGLHVTDLIAGLLNGWFTGYDIAEIPRLTVGGNTYVYPLSYVTKQELHLYHYQRTGVLARHSHPNDWERNPLDRNFYYYLADLLQEYWPGMEIQLFAGHRWRLRRSMQLEYIECGNCRAHILNQPFRQVLSGECDACTTLRQAGFIDD